MSNKGGGSTGSSPDMVGKKRRFVTGPMEKVQHLLIGRDQPKP